MDKSLEPGVEKQVKAGVERFVRRNMRFEIKTQNRGLEIRSSKSGSNS